MSLINPIRISNIQIAGQKKLFLGNRYENLLEEVPDLLH